VTSRLLAVQPAHHLPCQRVRLLHLPLLSCRQPCCCLLCRLSFRREAKGLQQLPPHRLRIRVSSTTRDIAQGGLCTQHPVDPHIRPV
jgi:hypothetical protein